MSPRVRLVCEPGAKQAWIIQYSRDDATWTDTLRFDDRQVAVRYLADVTCHDRILEEGAR